MATGLVRHLRRSMGKEPLHRRSMGVHPRTDCRMEALLGSASLTARALTKAGILQAPRYRPMMKRIDEEAHLVGRGGYAQRLLSNPLHSVVVHPAASQDSETSLMLSIIRPGTVETVRRTDVPLGHQLVVSPADHLHSATCCCLRHLLHLPLRLPQHLGSRGLMHSLGRRPSRLLRICQTVS